MGLTVFARVYLTGQGEDQVNHFSEEIGKLSQVVECHLMAGDCDFLLRVVVDDLGGYRRSQGERLARIKGVQCIKTDIPMQMVKQSWEGLCCKSVGAGARWVRTWGRRAMSHFEGHHFEGEIVPWAVRWYCRYGVS